MKQINYKIYHQGCWCSETTERFPGVKFEVLTAPIILQEKKTGAVHRTPWKIISENKNLNCKFIQELKKHKDVINIKVLETDGFNTLLVIEYFQRNSTYEKIMNGKILTFGTPFVKNGYEVYNILTEDNYKIDKILNELEEVGELKIIKMGKFKKQDSLLTEKQKQALQIAISHKYYSWPKKITLKHLAEKIGISRSVYEEHLRKAESKVFPIIINKNPQILREE